MSDTPEYVKTFTLPEGRMINGSLFKLDQYDEKSKPRYNIEVAFNWDDIQDVEDRLAAAAAEIWGEGYDKLYFDNKVRSPILDGNQLKANREAKGKPGEAYADKAVIRAHTYFNADGVEGPGGINVYDEDADRIDPVKQSVVYNGCQVIAAVSIGSYMDEDPRTREAIPCLMFYLSAVQKVGDGEKLVSAADHSNLFKPVGRKQGEGTAQRKRGRPGS